jgi:uncharacterized protein YcnI
MVFTRLVGAGFLGFCAVLGFAGAASAHVTVDPSAATQGGFARVAFRVPTESDTASTTKVEVNLPADAPVGEVSTMPVPGWTVSVEKRKLATPVTVEGSQISEAVSKITWTAAVAGAAIKPGQFLEFPVSMGPLPQVDRMIFKTLQTYSDGTIVRWIEEPPAAGGAEPENPAPVLALAAAAVSPSSSAAGPSVSASGSSAGSASGSGSGAGVGLGIAGLVAGLGGLALGGLAFARTRR